MEAEWSCRCGARVAVDSAVMAPRCPVCGRGLTGDETRLLPTPPVAPPAVPEPESGETLLVLHARGAAGEPDGAPGGPPSPLKPEARSLKPEALHGRDARATARELDGAPGGPPSPPPGAPVPAGRRYGHFEIIELRGQGGMGRVYKARDLSLDRLVALKVLRPEFGRDPAAVRRFLREARAAAALAHEHLTHIYFIGREGEEHYFAMEYLEGETLEELLERRGRLRWTEALDMVIQAARGLRAARGIVHRDVKPANLMRRCDGVVKITDFGLAKELDRESEITKYGSTVGTPHYMAPEQARGEARDHRVDLYGLGATFYHLLTGAPPYAGATSMEVLIQHATAPVPKVRARAPEVPPALARIVERLLAKEPADRYPDYDRLLVDLEACRPRPAHCAGVFVRLFASLVDLTLWGGATLFALWTLAAAALVHAGEEPTLRAIVRHPLAEHYHLVLGALLVLYEAGCTLRWRRTLGKSLFDLELVNQRAQALVPRLRLLQRAAVKWGAFVLADAHDELREPWKGLCLIGAALLAAFNLALLYVALSRRRLSMLDMLTRTRVVYRLEDAQAAEEPPAPAPAPRLATPASTVTLPP